MRLPLLRLLVPMLLILCLAGCGQTGRLFLRMPPTTFPPLAPPPHIKVLDIVAPPGSTTPAAVTASAPAAATLVPGRP